MYKKKYVIGVIGRFIFFDIAEKINGLNSLTKIHTSYPKYFFKKNYDIAENKIKSFFFLEIFRRFNEKFLKIEYVNLLIKKLFGKISSHFIMKDNFDIFIFFPGNAFYSNLLIKLKKKNVLIIAIEGSTHVDHRYKVLKKEYEILGQYFVMNDQKSIIKETKYEYELADHIIVPSEYVKKSFIENGINEKKLTKIPFGLNINKFTKQKRVCEKFKIIFVGGITIRKGIGYLIDAIINLKKIIDVELWLVGTIDPFYSTKKYPDFINFIGHIDKNKLSWYYSQCDIFCHPSLEEGLSSTILEAMSVGLPIICTENSGGAEIINQNSGFIIPAKSSEAISQIIKELYLDKEKLSLMSKAAKQTSINNFNWSNFVQKMQSINL